MALTEKTVADKYEIVNADTIPMIQCRHATVIERDGVELTRSFSRHVIAPTDDVSGESAQIQALAAALFTADVVAAYEAKLAADAPVVAEEEPTPEV